MEEKIQPTIKESPTANLMMMSEQEDDGNGVPSRKNSMTKSLSQVSIISSLLNEEEKRFLGGSSNTAVPATKNQSNLYSTPAQPTERQQKAVTQHHHIPDTPMSLSPELKPLSINTISPEPEMPTKELSKSASNLLRDQEKNLHLPNSALPPGSVAGTHITQQATNRRITVIMWLGGLQMVLSIILVALGGLVIARGASLAGCCAGVWTGAIAGLTGAFGIMGSIKKAQTAFLACSLICVASSTLALALTGIGAVRDTNFAQQDEVSVGNRKTREVGFLFGFIRIYSMFQFLKGDKR